MAKQKKQVKQNKQLIDSGLFSPESLCLICNHLKVADVTYCGKTLHIFQPVKQFNLISVCEYYESKCC